MATRIFFASLMFIFATIVFTNFEGFKPTLMKGGALAALIFPPLYFHFNDEEKYLYTNLGKN